MILKGFQMDDFIYMMKAKSIILFRDFDTR